MMDPAAADRAAALYEAAVELSPDVRAACLALIAAAMAGQELLRASMPNAKVEDMLTLLSVAGSVLIDDQCGGLLELVAPVGTA